MYSHLVPRTSLLRPFLRMPLPLFLFYSSSPEWGRISSLDLVVTHIASLWSLRTVLPPLDDSLVSSHVPSWFIPILRHSTIFYDDASRSTYIPLPLYYFLTFILRNTRYLVASKSYLEISSDHPQSSLQDLPHSLSPSLDTPKDVVSLREHLP